MPIRPSLRLLACLLALGLAATRSHAATAEHEGHDHSMHEGHAAAGDDPHAHHRAMLNKPAAKPKATSVDLKDMTLVDQDGKEVRFVSDAIGDHIVVMDFIYTTCTTICPVLDAVMGQIQGRLGDRLGGDVVMLSLTVDCTRDTPQRLKTHAAKHKARPGWTWLTGPKPTMDEVLDGLGAYSPNFEDHAPMILVGDGRTGEWTRFFGFPSPDRIVEKIDALQAARQEQVGD